MVSVWHFVQRIKLFLALAESRAPFVMLPERQFGKMASFLKSIEMEDASLGIGDASLSTCFLHSKPLSLPSPWGFWDLEQYWSSGWVIRGMIR